MTYVERRLAIIELALEWGAAKHLDPLHCDLCRHKLAWRIEEALQEFEQGA
jgi:predicted N-acyltransferase